MERTAEPEHNAGFDRLVIVYGASRYSTLGVREICTLQSAEFCAREQQAILHFWCTAGQLRA